jgi:hypothetical protein
MKALDPEFTRLAQEHQSNLNTNGAPVAEAGAKLTVPISSEQELPLAIELKHPSEVIPLNSLRDFGINE